MAPASLPTVFVAELHLPHAWPAGQHPGLPGGSTWLGPGSQQLGRPSSGSGAQHAPALAGRSKSSAPGLAKQKGRGNKGGKEAGENRASPFCKEALREGGETTTSPPPQLFSPT